MAKLKRLRNKKAALKKGGISADEQEQFDALKNKIQTAKAKKPIQRVRGKLQDARQAANADGVKTSAEQAKIDRLKEKLGDKRDAARIDPLLGKPKNIDNMEEAALGAVRAGAANLQNGEGFNPYTGQRVADFAPETEQAMAGVTKIANEQANGGLGTQSADLVKNLLSGNIQADALKNSIGGIASGAQGQTGIADNLGSVLSGSKAIDALSSNIGGIASGAEKQDALANTATDIASGAKGLTTESDLRTLLANSGNPAFQGVIDTQAAKLTDDITRAIGQNDGAIGSAYHTGTITDQVGDLRSKMAAENWDKNIANQSNLLGQITGVQGGNIGTQLAAAGQLSGEQGQNLQSKLAGASALAGEQGANIGNQINVAGALSGEQGQNLNRQVNAASQLSGEQFGNIGNQMQGVGLTAQANQNLYNPYQMLGTVGAAKEGQQTAQIQADMNAFNEGDMQNVNRLNNWAGLITGAGQLAPAAPQAVQNSNPFGTALSGAIQGAGLFPGNPVLGALGGGVLGGASQLFS